VLYYKKISARINLVIYDMTGRKVKMLLNGNVTTGSYQVQWREMNENGQPVASGEYICRLTLGNDVVYTHKMLLIR